MKLSVCRSHLVKPFNFMGTSQYRFACERSHLELFFLFVLSCSETFGETIFHLKSVCMFVPECLVSCSVSFYVILQVDDTNDLINDGAIFCRMFLSDSM